MRLMNRCALILQTEIAALEKHRDWALFRRQTEDTIAEKNILILGLRHGRFVWVTAVLIHFSNTDLVGT